MPHSTAETDVLEEIDACRRRPAGGDDVHLDAKPQGIGGGDCIRFLDVRRARAAEVAATCARAARARDRRLRVECLSARNVRCVRLLATQATHDEHTAGDQTRHACDSDRPRSRNGQECEPEQRPWLIEALLGREIVDVGAQLLETAPGPRPNRVDGNVHHGRNLAGWEAVEHAQRDHARVVLGQLRECSIEGSA